VEGRTGQNGRFRLEVEEGTPVRLQAHHSDLGFATVEVRAPASDLQLRLEPRAGLEVVVLAGGRRLAGVEITVRQRGEAGGEFHADRVTDERGTLRFLGLPPGALEVEALVPATGARGVAVVDAQEGAVAPVQVTLPEVAGARGGG
jgi:hypothetical protein